MIIAVNNLTNRHRILVLFEKGETISMEKPIVNMSNWQLYVYNDEYNLSGTADHHPSLGNNIYVAQTSTMVDYHMEDDVLTYETRNTIYRCPLKYLTPHPYTNVVGAYIQELSHRGDASENVLDKIISVSAKLALEIEDDDPLLVKINKLMVIGQQEIAEAEKAEDERLINIAKGYDDCIYLEASNIECGDKISYHIGELTGTVKPSLHSGMFQDSVLYIAYNKQDGEKSRILFDFRYFPSWFGYEMETYMWSPEIRQAVIKNVTNHSINFNNNEIKPGELKIFKQRMKKTGEIKTVVEN